MSEAPETKVLKEILPQIKIKALKSQILLLEETKLFFELMEKITLKSLDYPSQGTVSVEDFKLMMTFISSTLSSLNNSIRRTIDDNDLYTDIIEKLAKEYDSTLTGIFEQVKRSFEESQQNKKKSVYT